MDSISSFLKGPHRQRKNDERYIGDVKKVLAWYVFRKKIIRLRTKSLHDRQAIVAAYFKK